MIWFSFLTLRMYFTVRSHVGLQINLDLPYTTTSFWSFPKLDPSEENLGFRLSSVAQRNPQQARWGFESVKKNKIISRLPAPHTRVLSPKSKTSWEVVIFFKIWWLKETVSIRFILPTLCQCGLISFIFIHSSLHSHTDYISFTHSFTCCLWYHS